jgi:rfaE bifunctional protein kinase chain/domain
MDSINRTLLDTASSIRVLVVGDTMLDRYWLGDVDRISPEAPVPIINVNVVEECAGGAGNVAANIASLGARCDLLSFIGDDDAGKRLDAILAEAHVDRHLHIDAHGRTTE